MRAVPSGGAAGPSRRNAVAIGVFDGLHLGHAEILGRALGAARALGGRTIVLSFDPHPDVVLAPSFQPVAPLTPLPEKRERLRAMGVDQLEVLPFTRELAALSPEEFVDRHVALPHAPAALVVGEDFALGHRRAGDCARLREIGRSRGFDQVEAPLCVLDGAVVSSTRIRELLGHGQVAEAARLLGRRYALSGAVVTGNRIGRTLGFPTANLRLHQEKLVPGHGIYAVWARIGGREGALPGAMSIGVRPTFGGHERTLEVHLLDWEGELVGLELEVEFVDWLRAEERFESPEALKAAIAADVAETRRRLSAAPARSA